ncbi:MAG: CDGSH iron-sulfur domain-containing protein [Actinomycetota bacterium]|nr:CDGSH iron-sulfur domain-containing protein [Actinomycetota bacterium]
MRGNFTILSRDGYEIDCRRRTVALCRCGRSALKPFCDGSHKTSEFRAPAAAPERPT